MFKETKNTPETVLEEATFHKCEKCENVTFIWIFCKSESVFKKGTTYREMAIKIDQMSESAYAGHMVLWHHLPLKGAPEVQISTLNEINIWP